MAIPSFDEIQQYLTGTWRMMTGRPDGLDQLDISSDGFWNSFFAIVLVVPVFAVDWVAATNELALATDGLGTRGTIVLRLAIADLTTWLVPIAVLAIVAGPLGIGDRFVHYVIASNWAAVLLNWLLLPISLIDLAGIEEYDTVLALVLIVLLVVALVLYWRLINAVLQKGAWAATLLFAGMLFAEMFVFYSVRGFLGVSIVFGGQS